MNKEYTPESIETKWQTYWEENSTNKVDNLPKSPDQETFYCLDMFPYPSGSGLHVGHPLGYTATDIVSRFKKMQGAHVLHPMGFDAFGLPAEQHAVATGEHPASFTDKNCDHFTTQLKKLGLCYDWDREVRTCHPDYYQWTQWIFTHLFNSWYNPQTDKAENISTLVIPEEVKAKGEKAIFEFTAEHRLAFYTDAMVNWCPALGTVLANEEVIDGKSERGSHPVVRKPMKQWMLRITKYAERLIDDLDLLDWPESIKEQQRNWIGKKKGAEIIFQVSENDSLSLTAFTTRPDTLCGVTFFVISPEHPLVGELTTSENLESVKEYQDKASSLSDLDRTIENREKSGVFTGSYVVNPINNVKIPIYVADYVLMSYGTGAVMGVPAHDERDYEFAKKYDLPINTVIVNPSEKPADKAGAYSGKGKMTDSEVHNSLNISGLDNETAGQTIVEILSKDNSAKWVVQYRLRDWLFSRQRYWGEPIPIIHWSNGTITSVSEDSLPVLLPQIEDYKPSDGGESPLAKATDWLEVKDEKTGLIGRRETNTMPQWAGSCWYYLRFMDPKNSEKAWDKEVEKSWSPVDLYVGGAEHAVLHLLYSRFWHKVLYDLDFVSTKEPFQKLYNQGLITAAAFHTKKGSPISPEVVKEKAPGQWVISETDEPVERSIRKMSKSLKNVVDPLEIIRDYGADSLRVYLMFMGPLDAQRPWDSKAINGCRRFLNRFWTFVNNSCQVNTAKTEDKKLISIVHKTVKKVTEDIEGLRFNTAVSTMMEALNNLWGKEVSLDLVTMLVKCLSPIAPHVSEEMYELVCKTTGNEHKSVSLTDWPKFDLSLTVDDEVTVVIQVNGKKREDFLASISATDDEIKAKTFEILASKDITEDSAKKVIVVRAGKGGPPKLVNVVN